MCGIAGFTLAKKYRGRFPVETLANELLLGVEARGRHATGFMSLGQPPRAKKQKVTYHKLAVTAADFIKIHGVAKHDHTALLHTRHWTKGDPKDAINNHPVLSDGCFVIHNGSISNDDEVIEEAGLKDERKGEVDSWAIPVALNKHGWDTADNIKKSLHCLQGSMAIAAVDPFTQPGKLLLAKGEYSPLHVLVAHQGIFWASEKKAIEDAWGKALGTPPKGKADRPGELGFYSFGAGEYWLIDTNGDIPAITPGKFDVNYPPRYPNTQWAGSYRRRSVEWTCWPNTKDCVFGDACDNCSNHDCACWDGNLTHPRLNKDTNYADLVKKHLAFKSHCDRFKLREEAINPIKGSSRGSVATIRSKNTSQGSTDTPVSSTENKECYFCKQQCLVSSMRKLNPGVRGPQALYECRTCQPLSDEHKLPVVLAETVKMLPDALEAVEVVDASITETAWEHRVDPVFVRYVCLFMPTAGDGKPEVMQDFIKEVKASFRANLVVVKELRDMGERVG